MLNANAWTRPGPRGRLGRVVAGGLLLLGIVVATSWITRGPSPDPGVVRAAAAVAGLGTIACALLFYRSTPYPRAAYLATAGLLAGSLILTPVLAGDPVRWKEHVPETMWMFPWFFLMMHSVTPASGAGWCAPGGRWASWLLLGIGMVLAACIHVPLLLSSR